MVKALDLSSNGRMSAWVRTPLLVVKFPLETLENSSTSCFVDTKLKRSYGVMVSTQDSESCDPSSNLGRT